MHTTIVEYYNYSENKRKADSCLALWIPILVLNYIVTIFAIIYLYQTKQYKLMITMYILLLCPFFITQCITFFISIYILSRHFFEIQWTNYPSFYIYSSFILYGITCYILLSLVLYFYCTMTSFDIAHQDLFQQNFISYPKLLQLKMIRKNQVKKIQNLAQMGKEHVKNKKIVFGFLLKNSEIHISSMQQKINVLGSQFENYHVILFENDSQDETRNLLHDWEQNDNHVTLLKCCDLGNCECKLNWKDQNELKGLISDKRIDKMRFMRQKVLNHVQDNFSSWDYFCFMDFDLKGAIFKDGFFTSFASLEWDMVFAAGYCSTPILNHLMLYDGIAFLDQNENELSMKSNDITKCFLDTLRMNTKLNKFPLNHSLRKCLSGFNGMAIYKISSILQSSYQKDPHSLSSHSCEHLDLHLNMVKKGNNAIYFNPLMVLFAGHQGPERMQVLKKIFTKSF